MNPDNVLSPSDLAAIREGRMMCSAKVLVEEIERLTKSLSEAQSLLSKAVYRYDPHWLNPRWECAWCGVGSNHHEANAPMCPFKGVAAPLPEAPK